MKDIEVRAATIGEDDQGLLEIKVVLKIEDPEVKNAAIKHDTFIAILNKIYEAIESEYEKDKS